MDFDPRDYYSRDDERHGNRPSRSGRGDSDNRDRDHDWSQPGTRTRDRDDDDARSLGRGPGSERQASDGHRRDRDPDPRWAERDRDDRERDRDVPNAFTRHVHLPRGLEREVVRDRDREYTLRGSESRTLATVGVFRVVSSRDLRTTTAARLIHASATIGICVNKGLLETARVPGYRDPAVTSTKEGRSLLESSRSENSVGIEPISSSTSRRSTASGVSPGPACPPIRSLQPVVKVAASTEGDEARRGQGATTENIQPYLREEQRSSRGCIVGRMPSLLFTTGCQAGIETLGRGSSSQQKPSIANE